MNEYKLNIPSIDSIRELMNPLSHEIKELKEILRNLQLEAKYYRNKDLKTKFGMSDKTIQNYREHNIIPFTKIGEIFYYPVNQFNEAIKANSNYDLFNQKLQSQQINSI
jgi:hypothetical protein